MVCSVCGDHTFVIFSQIINFDTNGPFYLLFILLHIYSVFRIIPPWSSDHLMSQINNVGTDIPFYLFFILWFQDPLHHLISQIIVDIGIMFYLWPDIYFMVCSLWRIIPPWSSDPGAVHRLMDSIIVITQCNKGEKI